MGSIRMRLGQGQQRVCVLCPIRILPLRETGADCPMGCSEEGDSCVDCLRGTNHISDNLI